MESALKLAEHITAMAEDSYLIGHPEWDEIVSEARNLIAEIAVQS